MSSRGRKSDGSVICPRCAEPKTLQARICQSCYVEDLKLAARARHSTRCACPSCREAVNAAHRRKRRKAGIIKGTPTGRPQPAGHPWRAR